MNNINFFIKKEFFLLTLLLIIFINPYFYGYRLAMLLFVFLFLKLNFFNKLIDKNVFYLLLFAVSYELLASLRFDYIDRNLISILPNVFVPSLLYLVGKYIAMFYKNNQVLLFILLFLAFSFSLIPMISVLLQIQENGFIEGTRSLYLIWDRNSEISATGIGSYFVLNMAGIGLININKKSILERRITWIIVVLFLLSLVCVLRLGSRTQLVIAFISLFGTYLLNFKKQSTFKNIIYACLFLCGFYYMVNNLNEGSDVVTFYADRMNNSESGFDTAGGRTERWVGSVEAIMTSPFGWEFSRFGYAHNLWLDVARVSGIIPLLFLMFFTVSAIRTWIKSLQNLKEDLYLKNYVFMYFVSIFLLFCVEPIMDGMYLLLLLFCLFVGILRGNNDKVIKK